MDGSYVCPKSCLTDDFKRALSGRLLDELSVDDQEDASTLAEYVLVMVDNGKSMQEVHDGILEFDMLDDEEVVTLVRSLCSQLQAQDSGHRDDGASGGGRKRRAEEGRSREEGKRARGLFSRALDGARMGGESGGGRRADS
eukprot:g4591.t1